MGSFGMSSDTNTCLEPSASPGLIWVASRCVRWEVRENRRAQGAGVELPWSPLWRPTTRVGLPLGAPLWDCPSTCLLVLCKEVVWQKTFWILHLRDGFHFRDTIWVLCQLVGHVYSEGTPSLSHQFHVALCFVFGKLHLCLWKRNPYVAM